MNLFLFLMVSLAWGNQTQDGFNITFQLDKIRPAIFEWRITKDDKTALKCHLKCDLEEIKQVLHIGSLNKTIEVYVWNKDVQKFEKNVTGTTKTHGTPYQLLMDTTRGRLISLEDKSGGRLSNYNVSLFYDGIVLHSSGKFLLMSQFIFPGATYAMELMDNVSFAMFATYTPPKPANGYIRQVFHPKAHDVVAVTYPSLKTIRFLRLDIERKNITFIADVEEGGKPSSLIFSGDGMYMYVTNQQFQISSYEVDVTNFAVRVRQKFGSATLLSGGYRTGGDVDLMAFSPSQKHLYLIPHCRNYVAMFNISSSTRQLLPNGFKATGGNCSRGLAMAPDGSHLLVRERENEILIFNIQTDGTLKEAGKIEGVIKPTAMLYTTKQSI